MYLPGVTRACEKMDFEFWKGRDAVMGDRLAVYWHEKYGTFTVGQTVYYGGHKYSVVDIQVALFKEHKPTTYVFIERV